MMETINHFFKGVIEYLHQNPGMGGVLAFIISFSESLPIIGTIVPGSITMTAIGTLIGASILPATSTLSLAVLGAFCGDFVGYAIGYYYQESIRKLWPISRYPHWLEKGEGFVARHGGKSILIGRFVGPARSAVPMVAGILRMHWLRFVFAAIPSAILWAFIYITPGILLGALSLEIPASKTTEFVLVGLGVIIAVWLIFWAIQYFFRQIIGFINRKIDQLWAWLNKHHSSEWFIKIITNRDSPNDHYQLTLSLLSLLFFILFIIIFANVIHKTSLTALNNPIFHLLQSIRTPKINALMVALTTIAEPKILVVMAFFAVFLLAVTRQWRACCHLLALTLLVAGTVAVFKDYLFYSPRPTGIFMIESSSSFPSGHTALGLAYLGFFAYWLTQSIGYRWLVYLLVSILITLIAFSRIYLGAHWFTDILASICLGLGFLLAVIISYRRFRQTAKLKQLKFWPSLLLIFLITVPLWTLALAKNFHKEKIDSAPYFAIKTISLEQWWNNSTQNLPIYRNNRFGKPLRPFNLQWLGQLEAIQQFLSDHGWTPLQNQHTLKFALQRFASKDPIYHMPFLSQLHLYQKPRLVMIKQIADNQILVIRLWDSAVKIAGDDRPLYIGSLYLQFPPPRLISFHRRELVSFQDPQNLQKLLGEITKLDHKIVVIPKEYQPKQIQDLEWGGEILLIRG